MRKDAFCRFPPAGRCPLTAPRIRLPHRVWSTPKAVDNDGTNDGSPVLATDGETVFIAWQNLKRSLTEADEDAIDAVLESTEFCIAQYDAKADSFGNKKTLTDNAVYEYAPALAVETGEAVLYWVSSGTNDLTEAGSNTLYRYSSSEGEATAIKTGLNYILTMDCAFVDGQDQVAYSMDLDGDVSTTNDVKAFTLAGGKQTQLTPENEELETADFAVAYGEFIPTLFDFAGKCRMDMFDLLNKPMTKEIRWQELQFEPDSKLN